MDDEYEDDTPSLVEGLVYATLDATEHGRSRQAIALLNRLAGSEFAAHRALVDRRLLEIMQSMVTKSWLRGWQPDDVLRFVGRKLSAAHVSLAKNAIAAEMRGYAARTVDPRWQAQLHSGEITVWWAPQLTYLRADPGYGTQRATLLLRLAEIIVLFSRLPTVELHLPVPGTAVAGGRPTGGPQADVDERTLGRIRALLAKAESTQYPAEAETYSAAAQSLMAKHSIDAALLDAARPGAPREVEGRRLGIDNPYEGAKVTLLNAVANANRVRIIWSRELFFVTLIGFPSDLEGVERLYTSLLVQANSAMAGAGADTGAGGQRRSRSFRQSFLTGYALRIGERLNEAADSEVREAAAEPSGGNLLPVLASRAEAVDAAVEAMFPQVVTRATSSVTDGAGWVAGRGAADLASLGTLGQVKG